MVEPARPIRFDRTLTSNFYMCRSCRNHVLSKENYCFGDAVIFKVIIGENAVNVRSADVESHLFFLDYPVVEVFCNGCTSLLGYKFVMIEESTNLIQEGRFMFRQSRLLYWDGNMVVYPNTLRPVEDD